MVYVVQSDWGLEEQYEFDIEAGIAYHFNERNALSLDISYDLSSEYETRSVSLEFNF